MSSRPSSFSLTTPGPIRLYSTAELLELPPPTYLIEPIMPSGGFVGLYGPSNSGKTFVSIDMAMSIATGTPWQDRPTQKGYVIYISGEGGTGIGKRILAWLVDHAIPPEEARIAWMIEPLPVSADSEQLEMFLNRVTKEVSERPILVVVDTLARCFVGNENEQEDMGRFVAGVDRLRHELDTTVLFNHHTRLDNERERGNTALRAASDTMIAIEGGVDTPQFVLVCTKQRDDEHFPDIELERAKVEGTGSCVVKASTHALDSKEKKALVVGALRMSGPSTWDVWLAASGVAKTTFHRFFVELKRSGEITKEKGLWRVV